MFQFAFRIWRSARAPVLLFSGILLVLAFLLQGMSRLTWALSDAGRVSLSDLKAAPASAPGGDGGVSHHRVSEWPVERERLFQQAPELDERVARGDLPPVEQRLPARPLVVEPPEQIGPYGGTWRIFSNSPADAKNTMIRTSYETLVRWSPDGRDIWPNVFRDWEIADEGREYTFHLREGLRWSDGHPVSAEDIEFWFEHVATNTELSATLPREMRFGGATAEFEKIDDYTVRFRFAKPYGLLLHRPFAGELGNNMLQPKHYLSRFHAAFFEGEDGAAQGDRRYPARICELLRDRGFEHWSQLYTFYDDWRNPDRPTLAAWQLTRPPPARPLVYERNPYYWKVDPEGNQLPYIDRIEVEMFDSEIINLRALEGRMDMQFRHLSFDRFPLLMKNREQGGYQVRKWLSDAGGELILFPNLNHRDPVMRDLLHDRRFRIALSHAIDRDTINEVKFFGVGTPRQPLPNAASPYHVPGADTAYIEFDPEKANRLLDEMGLDKRHRSGIRLRPDGRRLRIRIDTTVMMNGAETVAPLIAEMWGVIGIQADVATLNRDLFWERKKATMHDILIWLGEMEHNPPADPRVLVPFSPDSNHAIAYALWFQSDGRIGDEPPPELRRAIEIFRQVEQSVDPDERIELFKEIVKLNEEHLWVIGTIGEMPIPVVVGNHMRNVPDVATVAWVYRTPLNTAPECYAIDRR